jgi:hypothetical protein
MAQKYIRKLNKETLALVKNDVLASFEVDEILKMSFEKFFSEVDVQNAYEEEWQPAMYEPYYLEVYNQITRANKTRSNPTQFYNSWIPLTKEEFDHEWDSENIVFFFSSAYNKKSDEQEWRDIMFEMLPKISSVEKITKDQLNPRNPDYYVANGLDVLQEKIGYMRPIKDVFGLANKFEHNKPLYMPMILKDGDTYKTISGRTRMSVAFIMDYPVQAIVIDKNKFKHLVILPIKRDKYLSSNTFFTNSSETRQTLLDYVDGKIRMDELRLDKELRNITNDELKFEIDMAQRHSFKPYTKNNPMKKEIKLLASAPTLDGIRALIAKYWYNKPEKIILTPIDESHWSIFQIGDMGNREMKDNIVELKKGRYRFLYSPDVKSNPVKVKKGPREYGTRDGGKLNLTQALEIRDNDYRTRDAQHDYDPESVDQRIYYLQNKIGARQVSKVVSKQKGPEKVKIKILWQTYKSLTKTYVYLELPDTPFYNVKLMVEGDGYLVIVGDGYKVYHEKSFDNIDDAIKYAHSEFLRICADDPEYVVSIKPDFMA